jgi:hypothetical protein
VVNDLSRHLFEGMTPDETSAWEGIPKEDIRQTALLLLQKHDTALAAQGASTTKGVINF